MQNAIQEYRKIKTLIENLKSGKTLPLEKIQVWCRLSYALKNENERENIIDTMINAIENGNASVTVLIPNNGTMLTVPIPQECVKDFVSIECVNTDLIDYNKMRNVIECDTFEAFIYTQKVA